MRLIKILEFEVQNNAFEEKKKNKKKINKYKYIMKGEQRRG